MKRVSSFLVIAMALTTCISMNSCGGNNTGGKTEEEAKIDNAAFYESQPVESGLYDADYYDITGPNSRKGHFDGRIYFSLSPETSAFYVFENGNRTKISELGIMPRPFEKGDSGIYSTVDSNNLPVIINTDSASYILCFQNRGSDYKITFNPKPRHTGTAVEILEKINTQRKK